MAARGVMVLLAWLMAGGVVVIALRSKLLDVR
jgi:hypothetical protein